MFRHSVYTLGKLPEVGEIGFELVWGRMVADALTSRTHTWSGLMPSQGKEREKGAGNWYVDGSGPMDGTPEAAADL